METSFVQYLNVHIQGKHTLFDLSKMCAFEPSVMAVSQENANGFSGISRFLSDSVGS